MRSAAIRDVNFNLGEDDGGDRDSGGGSGGDRGSSYVTRARARGTIHDLDHISSLRLRENPSTTTRASMTRSLEVKCRSKFSRLTG